MSSREDVPESAVESIDQRRCWLNGSFAASFVSIDHVFKYNLV